MEAHPLESTPCSSASLASLDERLLALAIARGLLEPEEARGQALAHLVAAGRLSREDRELLEQELEELSSASASHWSVDMTGGLPALESGADAPTLAHAQAPGPPADPLTGIRVSQAEGVFKARTLARWGRFERLERAGDGGMGRIFRAEDPRLRRTVALKLLRRDDPDLLRRFLQEAQLQARVDHPNVCRVYEVGEWRGQPYIVMQYIQGKTLREARADLSMAALLELLVQVCEGVHAAHRVGLVHRDLKPSNLMMEATEEGSLRAFVLDFGLARRLEGGGTTQTGHVMGTVSYMSPEQVRGESATLDRRSDVYSLGATVHTLLAGAPPFEGDGLECMARIAKDDPVPLRRLVPGLPADLETVVLTCLDKDPRRRYATARALGEDLQRVLDHEPIQARPATLAERVLHWARKRKATVTAAALVVLAALVFGGFAVRERVQSQRRTAYAQRFAQAAERIEALARYLRIQPARDLAPEQADLRARVTDLEAQVRAAGTLAEAPGAYALGRAHLALDEPEQARTELERAWSMGFRTPEAAHALGRALAALYQVGAGKAAALPDAELKQRRLAELDRTLRVPAASWLGQGASASLEPPAFRDGLLALMQSEPRRAVDLARRAQVQAPWFYEALRLEAEGWLAQARAAQGPQAVQVALASAGQALAEAELRAPCDVDLLRLDMRRWQEAVALNWQTGADPRALVEAQVAVADRWLHLEPAAAQPLAWRARARGEEARFLSQREQNPDPWLAQGQGDAAEALRRDPEDVEACTAQASVLRTEGLLRMNRGEDPTPQLKAAVALADRGLRRDPGHIVLMNIRGAALLFLVDRARMGGSYDPAAFRPYLQEARNLASAHPGEAYYQGNLGTLAQAAARADAASGSDPMADAETAVAAYEASLKAQPNHAGFPRGILLARAAQARALVRDGKDPGSIVDQARETFVAAQKANLPMTSLAPWFLEALVWQAGYVQHEGGNPNHLLDEAGKLAPMVARVPEDQVAVGAIRLRYLALALRASRPHGSALRAEGAALVRSLARLKPIDPDYWVALGSFLDACGNHSAASRARAHTKVLSLPGPGF